MCLYIDFTLVWLSLAEMITNEQIATILSATSEVILIREITGGYGGVYIEQRYLVRGQLPMFTTFFDPILPSTTLFSMQVGT